jgi:hypothetical protein
MKKRSRPAAPRGEAGLVTPSLHNLLRREYAHQQGDDEERGENEEQELGIPMAAPARVVNPRMAAIRPKMKNTRHQRSMRGRGLGFG